MATPRERSRYGMIAEIGAITIANADCAIASPIPTRIRRSARFGMNTPTAMKMPNVAMSPPMNTRHRGGLLRNSVSVRFPTNATAINPGTIVADVASPRSKPPSPKRCSKIRLRNSGMLNSAKPSDAMPSRKKWKVLILLSRSNATLSEIGSSSASSSTCSPSTACIS